MYTEKKTSSFCMSKRVRDQVQERNNMMEVTDSNSQKQSIECVSMRSMETVETSQSSSMSKRYDEVNLSYSTTSHPSFSEKENFEQQNSKIRLLVEAVDVLENTKQGYNHHENELLEVPMVVESMKSSSSVRNFSEKVTVMPQYQTQSSSSLLESSPYQLSYQLSHQSSHSLNHPLGDMSVPMSGRETFDTDGGGKMGGGFRFAASDPLSHNEPQLKMDTYEGETEFLLPSGMTTPMSASEQLALELQREYDLELQAAYNKAEDYIDEERLRAGLGPVQGWVPENTNTVPTNTADAAPTNTAAAASNTTAMAGAAIHRNGSMDQEDNVHAGSVSARSWAPPENQPTTNRTTRIVPTAPTVMLQNSRNDRDEVEEMDQIEQEMLLSLMQPSNTTGASLSNGNSGARDNQDQMLGLADALDEPDEDEMYARVLQETWEREDAVRDTELRNRQVIDRQRLEEDERYARALESQLNRSQALRPPSSLPSPPFPHHRMQVAVPIPDTFEMGRPYNPPQQRPQPFFNYDWRNIQPPPPINAFVPGARNIVDSESDNEDEDGASVNTTMAVKESGHLRRPQSFNNIADAVLTSVSTKALTADGLVVREPLENMQTLATSSSTTASVATCIGGDDMIIQNLQAKFNSVVNAGGNADLDVGFQFDMLDEFDPDNALAAQLMMQDDEAQQQLSAQVIATILREEMQQEQQRKAPTVNFSELSQNRQSVHSGVVEHAAMRSIDDLERRLPTDVPRLERMLVKEAIEDINACPEGLPKNVCDAAVKVLKDHTAMKRTIGPNNKNFRRVLAAVYFVIRTHDHRASMVRRLAEEIFEGLGMCSGGRIGRLINALRGFINIAFHVVDSDTQVSVSDRISSMLLVNAHKSQEEKLFLARAILDECGVNSTDRDIWLSSIADYT